MKRIHLVVFLAAPLVAQAQIGKMAILDSLPRAGTCADAPVSEALKHDGVAHFYNFEARNTGRTVSLAVNAQRKPMVLSVLASHPLTATKGEGENIVVFFNDGGKIVRGNRAYMTTGQPASRAEDRKSGLFADDTVKVGLLVKALLARCGD